MRFAEWKDRDEVARICAHPDVRKMTAHDGARAFDAEPWLRGKNLVAVNDMGVCFLFQWAGSANYIAHTNVVPEARSPKRTLEAAYEAQMLMFLSTDCEVLNTLVPNNNKAADWLTRCMGFRYMFTQQGKWMQKGVAHALHHWRIDIDDWILRGALRPMGVGFHEMLQREGLDSHPDDDVHDCYVGATLGMVAAGKVGKAIRIYNRWAVQAGYQLLTIESSDPLVIDAGTFKIHYETGGKLTTERKEKEYA